MRNTAMLLICLPLSFAAAPCWSVPDDLPATSASTQSNGDQATLAYKTGMTLVETADHSAKAAAEATEADARAAAQERARVNYTEARRHFQDAAKLDAEMPSAWNMVGYTERKLGNYDAALAAYERALTLRPNYPEAIEYRGEAYLGLNRIAEAKQAYLDLFASNRALSDRYLDAMKQWVNARRKEPGEVGAAAVAELDRWLKERAKIAAKTVALTREGAAASWR
jgi:tetratricopeptide (TPR) repeat protein